MGEDDDYGAYEASALLQLMERGRGGGGKQREVA